MFDLVYFNNIRRGNTIMISRLDSKKEKVYFARRGLKHNFLIDHSNLNLIDDLMNPINRVAESSVNVDRVVEHVFGSVRQHVSGKSQCSVSIFKATQSDGVGI